MKLEDMIMTVENRKGTEPNFLLNLADYMETAWKICGDDAADLADAIGALYGTKAEKKGWGDLYFAADRSIHAAFCSSEPQLREFLAGSFNGGEWVFDTGRCSRDCLDVLRIYNMKLDGQQQFPCLHYENVEHTFHAGETLHNLNGKDYYVLAALSPQNLLLLGLTDSQILVGCDVRLYERYPEGERPDSGSMVAGVEWRHGVYLGDDITGIDFDILRQDYGGPGRAEEVWGLRDQICRDFRMQKNVEQKEALPKWIRNAAKDCLEHMFGTRDPEVFGRMLDRGMYDRMYHAKEERKKAPGQPR